MCTQVFYVILAVHARWTDDASQNSASEGGRLACCKIDPFSPSRRSQSQKLVTDRSLAISLFLSLSRTRFASEFPANSLGVLSPSLHVSRLSDAALVLGRVLVPLCFVWALKTSFVTIGGGGCVTPHPDMCQSIYRVCLVSALLLFVDLDKFYYYSYINITSR